MAKKKKRSANVARKREKRNRNQKSKHKQLALEKQRRIQFSKLEEEDILDLLMNSRSLVLEPEFENMHFDLDETMSYLTKYIQLSNINTELNCEDKEDNRKDKEDNRKDKEDNRTFENNYERNSYFKGNVFQSMDNLDVFIHNFLAEAMPNLLTSEIIASVKGALSSCEKRFKRTGDRSQAETAFIARTFFDVAPKDQHIEHPILEGILINTIRLISTQKQALSSEMDEETDIDSDTSNANIENLDKPILRNTEQSSYDSLNETSVPDYELFLDGTISDKYPVNALYRNCIGIDIVELFENWETNQPETYKTVLGNASGQVLETYINITSDRINLFAHSTEELTIAMEALETYCQSAVMFLAKTIDEGGDSDGT